MREHGDSVGKRMHKGQGRGGTLSKSVRMKCSFLFDLVNRGQYSSFVVVLRKIKTTPRSVV